MYTAFNFVSHLTGWMVQNEHANQYMQINIWLQFIHGPFYVSRFHRIMVLGVTLDDRYIRQHELCGVGRCKA